MMQIVQETFIGIRILEYRQNASKCLNVSDYGNKSEDSALSRSVVHEPRKLLLHMSYSDSAVQHKQSRANITLVSCTDYEPRCAHRLLSLIARTGR